MYLTILFYEEKRRLSKLRTIRTRDGQTMKRGKFGEFQMHVKPLLYNIIIYSNLKSKAKLAPYEIICQ